MGRILCLLYHRVNNYDNDFYNITVSQQNFEEQMKYLKQNYQIIKFDEDWTEVKGDAVVISFDDGYMDNYQFAMPILQKYKIPATIFVTTNNINARNEYWWDEIEGLLLYGHDFKEEFELKDELYNYVWKTDTYENRCKLVRILRWLLRCDPSIERRNAWIEQLYRWRKEPFIQREENLSMTIEQIKELSNLELITIGGHTVNHPSLGALSYKDQKKEIEKSIELLNSITGKKIDVYSYPFGTKADFSDDTINILYQCGIKKATTTAEGIYLKNGDVFTVPRVSVRDCKIDDFKTLLNCYFE